MAAPPGGFQRNPVSRRLVLELHRATHTTLSSLTVRKPKLASTFDMPRRSLEVRMPR
jgi:hypothetical protein